jgi:hypothetical protein
LRLLVVRRDFELLERLRELELLELLRELDERLLGVLRFEVFPRVEPRFEPRLVCRVERLRVPDEPCPAL